MEHASRRVSPPAFGSVSQHTLGLEQRVLVCVALVLDRAVASSVPADLHGVFDAILDDRAEIWARCRTMSV